MREAEIERHLVKQAKWYGGYALKFIPLHAVGFPDRIVLLPGGKIAFIELKRPGEKPRKAQEWWAEKLRALGFTCEYFDDKARIDEWLAAFAVS